jgi:hypothetical protein
MPGDNFSKLKSFFDRGVCQRATAPLRDGIELSVEVEGEEPMTLSKMSGKTTVLNRRAEKPDMTFHVGPGAIDTLAATTTEDIGEIGVEILKLMAHESDDHKIRAKVHIGLFTLLSHGYLSVLPLGGATVTKFLASKGFSSIGKIKDGISRMKG